MAMEMLQVKIPKETKLQLPAVAARHNLTVPEMIRVILNLITSGRIELTIAQATKNDQPSRTH